MPSSQTTTDHETIRKWAEERQGHPARVVGTGGKKDAGLLRIDFDEAEPDTRLERISWEEFFEKFDKENLAFLYAEKAKGGEESRFFKFVEREHAESASRK
ncbi:MAG: hypothetical protein AB2L09_08675 [Coriobacteriia bacterium]